MILRLVVRVVIVLVLLAVVADPAARTEFIALAAVIIVWFIRLLTSLIEMLVAILVSVVSQVL